MYVHRKFVEQRKRKIHYRTSVTYGLKVEICMYYDG